MTLGVTHLAAKSLEGARLPYLDRPLSGTYSILSRDFRILLKRGESNLTRLSYSGEKVSMLDLRLELSLVSPSMELPKRRRLLQHRMIKALMRSRSRSMRSQADSQQARSS